MGVRAELREIPAAAFARVKAGGDIIKEDLETGAWTSLDKAWYDFHNLFKQMDSPLKYVIAGDYPYPLSPRDIETFVENDDYDFYMGFVSPPVVREISDSLSKLSDLELTRMLEEVGMEFDRYCQRYFKDMKRTYSQVAKNGNALYICIA